VIRRFYVHNFRCLENFSLPLEGKSSVLLIGRNGSGKTTVRLALELLQKIGRGANRVGELIGPGDLAWGRNEVPVRFEIEVDIEGLRYEYSIAFELPAQFKEFRVLEERLVADGKPLFTRKLSDITLGPQTVAFRLDWHLAALPIVQERSERDPISIFKRWLARMVILSPIPDLIDGGSSTETLEPDTKGVLFGAWFAGVIAHSPAAYVVIDKYLKEVLPDFAAVENPVSGKDYRKLTVQFESERGGSHRLPFETLSSGEKCFFICAMVLAASKAYGPLVCFWDEPDSHLALSEVGHFVLKLRATFKNFGQFIATSHTEETIRRFSEENTIVLHRTSHLEPITVRLLSELDGRGDVIGALIRGDLT
jgi:predicted ATPase